MVGVSIPVDNTHASKCTLPSKPELKEDKLIPGVIRVSAITFIGMTLFEVFKQFIFPDIGIWESHMMTIFFTTTIAVFASYMALKKYQILHKQLLEEFAKCAEAEEANQQLHIKLEDALTKVISGYVRICANCKKIHTEENSWTQVEAYVSQKSKAMFSHTICPECAKELYPEFKHS
ncbi:hypothetical protein Ctha_0816 [Chloroherpeton thalassium ATCC 35110]|uniref:Uncharacterized protein n=1 Tax=Chloroherpeton thalassium (strain ATCC 35110 / GB-78) TaxID=517418 RepID=B3QWS0_CHLT3|nr:hypothetical protein [Chloroherpeton thalassium]ACF13284.1 hypothetical protein Ctha_0816 [Chloroherpeton thalassium ATCC 35110]